MIANSENHLANDRISTAGGMRVSSNTRKSMAHGLHPRAALKSIKARATVSNDQVGKAMIARVASGYEGNMVASNKRKRKANTNEPESSPELGEGWHRVRTDCNEVENVRRTGRPTPYASKFIKKGLCKEHQPSLVHTNIIEPVNSNRSLGLFNCSNR